ncbi:MAG: class D sortase [Firmicutes bacterium]|nr:class D sortase [Bacillota bacterium]
MNLRKILMVIGILLIVSGVGVIIWFFTQNHISEVKMQENTDEFMSSLKNLTIAEKPTEKILVGDTTGVLEFPSFDNYRVAIKEGTSNYILSIAAGHMTNTEQVWDSSGTCAIAAHNNTFFKNVKDFKVGEKIIVYTRTGVYEYIIYLKKIIEPTDFSVLNDVPGQKTLTLITCNFSGTKRIIVMGKGGEKISEPQDI